MYTMQKVKQKEWSDYVNIRWNWLKDKKLLLETKKTLLIIKGSLHQKDINIDVLENTGPTYMKQKLKELKGEIVNIKW